MPTALTVPSKSAVNRAGDRLRDWWDLPTYDERIAALEGEPGLELGRAFVTVVAFRRGFQGPLNKVTMGLRSMVKSEMKELPVDGKLPVGQRMKRERQIMRKLSRVPGMNLARMQDIGGCRAIPTGGASEVTGILKRVRKNWEQKGFKDYVANPAPSGYRAIHVVVLREGHLIEIQLRTPRQQEWAEAVERTGFRLRIPLKDGEGPPELLDYFRLASHGLALEELGIPADEGFTAQFAEARDRVLPYFQGR
jgi:hypothetical protein